MKSNSTLNSFFVSTYSWIKKFFAKVYIASQKTIIRIKNQLNPYVKFNDAIKEMRKANCYGANNHRMMWENMRVSENEFYKNQLLLLVKDGKLALYGRNYFSANIKLKKIEARNMHRLELNKDNTCLVSVSNETIYLNISFNRVDLLI